MEILVNDKIIEFELDRTLTLPELLDNIQNWAKKDDLFILDYKVNGDSIENPVASLNSENIDKLEVLVGTRENLVWENLIELDNYIQKLYAYLLPRLRETYEVTQIDTAILMDGLSWILNSYKSLIHYFNKSTGQILTLEYLNEIIKNEKYILVLNFIQTVADDIALLKKQVFYNSLDKGNVSEIKELYFEELKSVIATLEKIASDLTIGKDQLALSTLENIIEWLSIGLMVFEKSGIEDVKIETVKEALNQLNEALGAKDFVSLADVIDFDLRDALELILIR